MRLISTRSLIYSLLLWHVKGDSLFCRARMFLHTWKQTVEHHLVSQWWWEKTETPKKCHRVIHKPKLLGVKSCALHGTQQHNDRMPEIKPFNRFIILTHRRGGSAASWMGTQPSWRFSGAFNSTEMPLAYLHRKQEIQHIFTGTDWNSASDWRSRCEQPISSQRRERSWSNCNCLSLSSWTRTMVEHIVI